LRGPELRFQIVLALHDPLMLDHQLVNVASGGARCAQRERGDRRQGGPATHAILARRMKH
jgi:hypothetical protein